MCWTNVDDIYYRIKTARKQAESVEILFGDTIYCAVAKKSHKM